MKNILNERPKVDLKERLGASVRYVSSSRIKNKKVLDIGCGYGWFELDALRRGAKEIIGTEITGKDLLTAKKYIKDKRAKFIVGSAIDLPFKKSRFDSVVCWEVIEHIPRYTENLFFSEVNRVLQNGGYFYLSTPYDSIISKFLDPAWWLKGHRHYNQENLKAIAQKNGFRTVDFKVKGRIFTLISLLSMYMFKWILRKNVEMPRTFLANVNEEYEKDNGYMDLFMKFQKIKDII